MKAIFIDRGIKVIQGLTHILAPKMILWRMCVGFVNFLLDILLFISFQIQ
jgi:hypothetical protein